ncbi:ABC transporter permease [Candidatus Gottesmanbacteria bacterium]|nr:ABC transporter permease [Candidatus Gottesmanbacteria bacterium]
MNYIFFIIKSALFDFSRNKLRTLLTSLGILIGVASVVLLTAFGLGLRKYIKQQFEDLGTNLLRVLPGKILSGGSFRSGPASFGGIRFDAKDVTDVQRVKGIAYVVPIFSKSVTISAGSQSMIGDIYASTSDIFNALNLATEYGRQYTKSDVEKRAKIALIGPKIADKLFGGRDEALGRFIKIETQNFLVIGVSKSKGGGFGGPDFDSFIYMPYTTAEVFNQDKKFIALVTKAEDGINLDGLKKDIAEKLLRRYKEDDFSVIEQSELIGAISSIFSIIDTVLVGIAAISLVVGGIGIMNIMFVSVTERIKEIGIRRAIGARKQDILWQFLAEAVILSLFGGGIGLLLSFGVTLLIQRVFPAYIDASSVMLALGVSSAIGIIFGILPAKKAADLSPIDAIRYE